MAVGVLVVGAGDEGGAVGVVVLRGDGEVAVVPRAVVRRVDGVGVAGLVQIGALRHVAVGQHPVECDTAAVGVEPQCRQRR